MKLFTLDAEFGKEIERFGSKNLIVNHMLHNTSGDIHIVCMHLGKSGLVGLHKALTPQLFVVIEGKGWVKGKEDRKIPISKGQIAFWDKEEWHETTTEDGLVAIVIEGDDINPCQFLKEIVIN